MKILLALLFLLISSTAAYGHSGRTDANGGHNCYTGACAGTYHYHNDGYESEPEYEEEYEEPEEEYTEPEPIEEPEPTSELTEPGFIDEPSQNDDDFAGGWLLLAAPFAGYGVYKMFKP